MTNECPATPAVSASLSKRWVPCHSWPESWPSSDAAASGADVTSAGSGGPERNRTAVDGFAIRAIPPNQAEAQLAVARRSRCCSTTCGGLCSCGPASKPSNPSDPSWLKSWPLAEGLLVVLLGILSGLAIAVAL